MFKYAKLNEFELSGIKAEGWLRKYLENQKNGLTGKLGCYAMPFKSKGWGSKSQVRTARGEAWWPYEPYGYWIEGMLKTGYLLDDAEFIKKAEKVVKFVISNPDKDGYMGPVFLKNAPDGKKNYRWPHAVFFRAVAAYYSSKKDKKALKALTNHFLSNTADHNSKRDVCNVEAMCWLYSKTGDERIINKALKAYKEYNCDESDADMSLKSMLSNRKATTHGVSFNEISKLAILIYLSTGEETYLNAVVNTYKKIDRDHMLIDGVHSSSENLNGKTVLESHETCDISDFTWASGYLLMATGDSSYADKIERAVFNAAPASVTEDFKELQYFSSPNQIVSDGSSNHNKFYKGGDWMAYRPSFITPCCVGSVNRLMPNYVSRMWLKDSNNGITAALYGPGRITTKAGFKNTEVTIVQETNYPFNENIHFQIRLDQTTSAVEFPFTLRIPGWCENAEISINGENVKEKIISGRFVTLKRKYKHNDRIVLRLPMVPKCIKWKEGVAVEYGSVLYALPIKERLKPVKSAEGFDTFDRYPAGPWNYALDIKNPDKDIKVIFNSTPQNVWSAETPAIELRVPARRVKDWKMIRCKDTEYEEVDLQKFLNDRVIEVVKRQIKGDFHFTPPLPKKLKSKHVGKKEQITLIPYGATTLRMTIFPIC